MAKGANGTIRINQQTINQRSQFGKNNSNLGVAVDRFGTDTSLFKDSPLALLTQDDMYQGDASGADSGGTIRIDAESIYEVYANVIDPEDDSGLQGFGFTGSSPTSSGVAYLNYRHPDNPFTEQGDYKDLTNRKPKASTKAYNGFPDLNISSLNDPLGNPTQDQDSSPEELNLDVYPSLTGDGASYGNTSKEYRSKIHALGTSLGTHTPERAEPGNGQADTLGKYFRTNIT